MQRFANQLSLFLLLVLAAVLASAPVHAQSSSVCQLSAGAPNGSALVVGESVKVETRLDRQSSGDTRTVGVKFEVVQGNAQVGGGSGPQFVPVQLTGNPGEPVTVDTHLVAQAAGPVVVQVTWLDAPNANAPALTCTISDSGGQSTPFTVQPHSFEVPFNAVAPARTLVLQAISGGGQQIVEGGDSQPFVLEVRSSDQSSVAGLPIVFEVDPAGALQLAATRVLVGADGRAQVSARGVRAGSGSLRAFIETAREAAPATFGFTVVSRLAGARLELVSGSSQNLPLNTFSAPLVVQARDRSGGALANAAVSWRIEPSTAATLEATSSSTDAAGRSQNRVRAQQAGSFVVVAQLTDAASGDVLASTVRFTLSAGSVPAGSTLSVISGDNQNLVPGTSSAPLVVELRNPQGQPVAGAPLRFSSNPSGAAVFNPADVVTGSDGRASTRLTPQLPGALAVTVAAVDDTSISARFAIQGGTLFIPGLNPNQQGVANAIDVACPRLASGPPLAAGSAQADLLARCSEIVGAASARPNEVRDVLNQLLPDEAAPQATASLSIRDAQLRNLDVRLDALRSGSRGNSLAGLTLNSASGSLPLGMLTGLARGVQDDPEAIDDGGLTSAWGAFLTGTIGRVDRDTTTNNPGFDGDTLSLTGGIDYRFSNSLVAGVALGYDNNDIDIARDAGAIDTRSLTLSLYGSYASDNDFYLDGRLAYGQLDFDLERNIRYTLGANPVDVTALASPEGNSRLFALTLGRNFNRNAWNFGGYLRGEISTIELDGYSESIDRPGSAGSGLAVRIDDRELDSRTATLGLRLGYADSRDWGVLLPFGRVEWVHEFEDDAQTTVARFINDPTGTPFVITGEPLDDGYGNVALGLTGVFANGRSAFVQYERRFAQDAIDRDSLTIGGRFEF